MVPPTDRNDDKNNPLNYFTINNAAIKIKAQRVKHAITDDIFMIPLILKKRKFEIRISCGLPS
jgi:hypothetical protein